jgi:hypothetical protein
VQVTDDTAVIPVGFVLEFWKNGVGVRSGKVQEKHRGRRFRRDAEAALKTLPFRRMALFCRSATWARSSATENDTPHMRRRFRPAETLVVNNNESTSDDAGWWMCQLRTKNAGHPLSPLAQAPCNARAP